MESLSNLLSTIASKHSEYLENTALTKDTREILKKRKLEQSNLERVIAELVVSSEGNIEQNEAMIEKLYSLSASLVELNSTINTLEESIKYSSDYSELLSNSLFYALSTHLNRERINSKEAKARLDSLLRENNLTRPIVVGDNELYQSYFNQWEKWNNGNANIFWKTELDAIVITSSIKEGIAKVNKASGKTISLSSYETRYSQLNNLVENSKGTKMSKKLKYAIKTLATERATLEVFDAVVSTIEGELSAGSLLSKIRYLKDYINAKKYVEQHMRKRTIKSVAEAAMKLNIQVQ